jgi:predicted nucleotidyltransferase
VEAEVFQSGSAHAVRPGPYTFASAREATAFVTEAVEALMYLGCDVQAA